MVEDHHAPLAVSRSRRMWAPSAKALENIASAPVAPAYGEGGSSMYAVSDFALAVAMGVDPPDWPAAMALPAPQRDAWVDGGQSEFDSHISNQTFGDFTPVKDLPAGTKLVKAADILKTKRDGRNKVRLVIKGFTMLAGIHFNQTFAPTVFNFSPLFAFSLRWLLKMTGTYGKPMLPRLSSNLKLMPKSISSLRPCSGTFPTNSRS